MAVVVVVGELLAELAHKVGMDHHQEAHGQAVQEVKQLH
jgi:hypothetical protein